MSLYYDMLYYHYYDMINMLCHVILYYVISYLASAEECVAAAVGSALPASGGPRSERERERER